MPNPFDAPDAVSAAAEPLEELLDDCNHVSSIGLFHVVPVAGTPPGPDRMKDLAQAVFDEGISGVRLSAPVDPFESPRAWREILHRQVTKEFMQPVTRFADPHLRTPVEIRRTGELATALADVIEAHLGPVRSCGEAGGPSTGDFWWRNLLLVTDDWATVLHLGISD
ncbi:hypothetical protein ACGFYZ_20900 [Streptomyces sp. NPDC048330]|uniref:hypothetical protein n=1 Tax=Streptomyces sp. NPDC048330 TaxID=3365533 RepID=UPI00371A483B